MFLFLVNLISLKKSSPPSAGAHKLTSRPMAKRSIKAADQAFSLNAEKTTGTVDFVGKMNLIWVRENDGVGAPDRSG